MVGVCIEMRNVILGVSVFKGKNLILIWGDGVVIKIEIFLSLIDLEIDYYKVYFCSFRIIRVYRIREIDGVVFDMNGIYYGYIFLWVDIDLSIVFQENEIFFVFLDLNWMMRVNRIFFMDKVLKMYYGEFGFFVDIFFLVGFLFVIKGIVEFISLIGGGICYDFVIGFVFVLIIFLVMIFFDFLVIGIFFVMFMDEYVVYDQFVKNSFIWVGILLFYDINVQF